MLAGQLANRGLIHYMGVAFNAVQGMCAKICIKGTQCISSHASNAQRNMWTTATIKKTCSEHQNWCQKKHKKKSLKTSKKKAGMSFHYHETGLAIDFENTQIIAEEKQTGKG